MPRKQKTKQPRKAKKSNMSQTVNVIINKNRRSGPVNKAALPALRTVTPSATIPTPIAQPSASASANPIDIIERYASKFSDVNQQLKALADDKKSQSDRLDRIINDIRTKPPVDEMDDFDPNQVRYIPAEGSQLVGLIGSGVGYGADLLGSAGKKIYNAARAAMFKEPSAPGWVDEAPAQPAPPKPSEIPRYGEYFDDFKFDDYTPTTVVIPDDTPAAASATVIPSRPITALSQIGEAAAAQRYPEILEFLKSRKRSNQLTASTLNNTLRAPIREQLAILMGIPRATKSKDFYDAL